MSLRHLFLNNLAQTSPCPLGLNLEPARAEGVYIYDNKGERYIDGISGFSVNNLGHGNKEIIDAYKNQLDLYSHLIVYGEYVQAPQVLFAKAIVDTLPENLDNVYFVNSGSEAIEGAMKLAKRFTNRAEFIACKNAYHGSTQGALSIMGGPYFQQAYRPLLPQCKTMLFNNLKSIDLITEQTAGVVIEIIQAEAGVIEPDLEFLIALRKKCTETGTLVIVDEIQTGIGRTGTMWAFEHYNLIPDVLLTAKALGGGLPIGAFISSKTIMKVLSEKPVLGHITTFGGHPVVCAGGLKQLEILKNTAILEEVAQKSNLFKALLIHPQIKRITGKGLLLAVHFDDENLTHKVVHACIQKGFITDWFLFCPTAMRVAPPLIISEAEIRTSCEIILNVLNMLQKN